MSVVRLFGPLRLLVLAALSAFEVLGTALACSLFVILGFRVLHDGSTCISIPSASSALCVQFEIS